MNRQFAIIISLALLVLPSGILAQKKVALDAQATPLKNAYIKYVQTSWQNFEFTVVSNLPAPNLKYQWTVDEKVTYETEQLRVFLPQGEHVVKVRVEDKVGNVVYDNVKLDIRFWSLHNNWFWWLVYLISVCVIVYYWMVKLVYLLNRKKVSRQVREFMDLLDEHGWIDRIIEGAPPKKDKNK